MNRHERRAFLRTSRGDADQAELRTKVIEAGKFYVAQMRARSFTWPRSVRRLVRDPLKGERRLRINKARANKALRNYGVTL